jgi:hypothetical protein
MLTMEVFTASLIQYRDLLSHLNLLDQISCAELLGLHMIHVGDGKAVECLAHKLDLVTLYVTDDHNLSLGLQA